MKVRYPRVGSDRNGPFDPVVGYEHAVFLQSLKDRLHRGRKTGNVVIPTQSEPMTISEVATQNGSSMPVRRSNPDRPRCSLATPWFLKPGAPANRPPAIAKPASVAANPVSGMTTALSVLGKDDGGEPNLTYTWSYSGPADVTFSANGPNRAKNTTVTFQSAGRYTFQVMIGDAGGLTATGSIAVTVVRPAAD